MANFINAQVGDKVYSLIHGEGFIEDIKEFENNVYPICVSFRRKHPTIGFTLDGKSQSNAENPILFWYKPQIIEQKRKVKKEVTYYLAFIQGCVKGNIYVEVSYYPEYFDDAQVIGEIERYTRIIEVEED